MEPKELPGSGDGLQVFLHFFVGLFKNLYLACFRAWIIQELYGFKV